MAALGHAITVTAAALQTCGSAPAADSDVTLQGIVGADGAVVADLFCFTGPPPAAPGIVQGTIQKIDASYGTISIVGFSAQPSVLTRVIDSSGSPRSLGDLKVGDSIAVDGAYGSIPELIWADGIVRLNGPQASMIDAWYELAKRNGAIGGKICGAGGGGFLMLYCEEDKHRLRDAMRRAGLCELNFRFEFEGSKVVFDMVSRDGRLAHIHRQERTHPFRTVSLVATA